MIQKISFIIVVLNLLTSCQAPHPTSLGIKELDGTNILAKCPESPNCVSSHFPEDKDHYLEPLKYETTKEEARNQLLSILQKTNNIKLIKNEPDYIHAEFTSSIFKFVDDLEFNFHNDKLIHFKSSSRIGYSDLGANKKRMSQITFRFYQNDM